MIRRGSAIKSLFIAILISIFLANGAQAVDPIRQYQIDVVPIANPGTTMNVTEEVSRQIIAQVDSAFNDATGGQIRFTFRKLHPISSPTTATLSSSDIQKATGLTPVPDAGFEKAILVGVIANTSAAKFAGQAVLGGNYVIMNGNWTLNSTGPGVLAHELGHSLGMSHANSAVCTIQLPIVCEQREYGDFSSVMGNYLSAYVTNPLIARFSATELDRLKVLPNESKSIAAESGDYKLAPAYSKGINLPKVLYIPIGSELTYSVEYRPAIGSDASLSQSKIYTPNGWSYTNTPSHGLQLRMLPTVGIQFKDSQPSHGKDQIDGTALVVSAFTADQVQAIGKVFTLSDGSTITFLSADPNTGATVRVERSPDKEAPLSLGVKPNWVNSENLGFSWRGSERVIFKKSIDAWDHPVIEIPMSSVTDNRLVKLVQIEVNGEIVGQVDTPTLNGIENYSYQTTKEGIFTFRLIATDFAGLTTTTEPTSLIAYYHKIDPPKLKILSGKDATNSVIVSVTPETDSTQYVLSNLSSGKIVSTVEKNGKLEFTITNLTRNQKFTAQLTGTDEMGYVDGGSKITHEPATTTCSNTKCFAGVEWNVDTGFWATGAGNMTLQERIGTKWVNIQTAKPVADPKGAMKNYVTYLMKINHKTPGKHIYRLSIAASKKYSGQITSTFTQVVSTP
jgi:hypothetical protein